MFNEKLPLYRYFFQNKNNDNFHLVNHIVYLFVFIFLIFVLLCVYFTYYYYYHHIISIGPGELISKISPVYTGTIRACLYVFARTLGFLVTVASPPGELRSGSTAAAARFLPLLRAVPGRGVSASAAGSCVRKCGM